MISSGHSLEAIRGYSYSQFRLLVDAVVRRRNTDLLRMMYAVLTGSRGSPEAVDTFTKEMEG